jgi:hypothetical protein
LAPDTDYNKRLKIAEGVEFASYGALVPVRDQLSTEVALERLLTEKSLQEKYVQLSQRRALDFEASAIIDRYGRALGL